MDGPSPQRLRFEIACQFPECGEVAAVVELVAAGGTWSDGAALHLSRFLPFTGGAMPVLRYDATVAAVLDAGDDAVAVLRRINEDYAPFFCDTCHRSYCAQHWNLEPVFDFGFDYYTGTCPVGHAHFIDH
jgi:hypothetical protein